MRFDPKKHHRPLDRAQGRRSIRLKEYDYTQPGGYFVTMATYHRDCIVGNVVNGEMQLNALGIIAEKCWRAIPNHFLNVELGAYVVMPNHVRRIIVINENGME